MEHTKIYHQTEIEVPGSEEALLGGGEKAKKEVEERGMACRIGWVLYLECRDLVIARDGE